MRFVRRAIAASLSVAAIAACAIHCDARPDVKSEIVRIDSPISGLLLALHHRVLASRASRHHQVVLFAEGSAVPTSGNAGFKINGVSWMDSLALSDFDVWSLDYLGYGQSSRYPDSDMAALPGRASDCASQLALAVQFILQRQKVSQLSLIGDSFGSLVAGIYATRLPDTIAKLILFAPITPLAEARPNQTATDLPKFHLVTPDDLWALYLTWLPKGEFVGLDRDFFVKSWGATYLDSDPSSRQRTVPGVLVPAGPDLDTIDIQRSIPLRSWAYSSSDVSHLRRVGFRCHGGGR